MMRSYALSVRLLVKGLMHPVVSALPVIESPQSPGREATGDRQTQGFGGLEVNDQVEFHGLLHR
jgi:hypothetical protein